jgi:hypothetical protein
MARRSPPPGLLPRSTLIEADLLRQLAIKAGNNEGSLSNFSFVQQSTVSSVSLGTALVGRGVTMQGASSRARASTRGESPVATL